MSRLKIKICGLRDNVNEVMKLKPDFVGFIYYQSSMRYVGPSFEFSNINSVKTVGIFVNENIDEVLAIQEKYHLNFVQLHGDESVKYCEKLKLSTSVIKVFPGNNLPNQSILNEYSSVIDFYLFDTKLTDSNGGTGKRFDWSVIELLNLKKPLILSGGIDLDSINDILSIKDKIYGIDVNSKFEIKPGLKDIDKLQRLLSNQIFL